MELMKEVALKLKKGNRLASYDRIICIECKQICYNKRDLEIHIANKHPKKWNIVYGNLEH